MILTSCLILSGILQGRSRNGLKPWAKSGFATSLVVAAELRYGAYKKGSVRLTNQLEVVLSALDVLPLEQPADDRYAELRVDLEQAGTPIGPNDMLLAAHALALGLILVTANVNEFSRVPGLALENWLV